MEKRETIVPEATIEKTDLLPFLEEQQQRLDKLSADVAGIAITDTLKESLVASADKLVFSTIAAREVIVNLAIEEKLEKFGGEASYETVWRYFVCGDKANLFRPKSIEEIWEHLAKNYDMSEETPEILAATLEEWAGDIEEDAEVKAGIRGRLIQHEGAFVFAEIMQKKPAAEESKAKPMMRTAPAPVEQKREKVSSPVQLVSREVKTILDGTPEGEMKQSLVKKALLADNSTEYATSEQLQEMIDELTANGSLFKFKRGLATHLSLTPRENETSSRNRGLEKEGHERFDLNIPLALDILRAFCVPGSHVQRKLTLNELWRTIHDIDDKNVPVPEREKELLKAACKTLKELDLVIASGEKMGNSGTKTRTGTSSKRRQSGTMHVYKVGLPNQQIKDELKEVVNTPSAVAYIQQKLDTINDTVV